MTTETTKPYGVSEVTDYQRDGRLPISVIGGIEKSHAGNLILRVGQMHHPYDQGWSQTEHVVLTPVEARNFIRECLQVSGLGGFAEAVADLLEQHGIAAVATALREEMAGAVQGLTADEEWEWNAALVKLETLAQKIT